MSHHRNDPRQIPDERGSRVDAAPGRENPLVGIERHGVERPRAQRRPCELQRAVAEDDAESIEVCRVLLEADTPVEMLDLTFAGVPKGMTPLPVHLLQITTH